MRKWIIAAFLIAGLAGCASTPEETTPTDQAATTTTAPGTGATTQGATTQGLGGSGVTGSTAGGGIPASALKDPRNILSKRNIYFDYDQFTVKDEYRPIVEAHAKYLQSNRSARAILQGHTDERGTREYNIRAGAEAGRRGEEHDAAVRRPGDPDRDGELRQGEAAARRP
jgi:peptidoglycan-associated lipoprotein